MVGMVCCVMGECRAMVVECVWGVWQFVFVWRCVCGCGVVGASCVCACVCEQWVFVQVCVWG